ncbi:thiopeptide-type bacteriocin biosynthesis protein [Belliella aquatica]|nr:thiopeptide-type bacteriocin biosynthesis protein [Belliella aquatica]MCH7407653.1 lantibiotic dehydratase [Belliella aquatica]
MGFIVRIPLVDFNIENEKEVEEKFDWIKEAIKHSSISLYKVVKDQTFAALDDKIKLKVYKYLKRGKFRAVPFGCWSGVGVGNWGEKHRVSIQRVEQISTNSKNSRWQVWLEEDRSKFCTFRINPTLQIVGDWLVYFSFETKGNNEDGQWEWIKVKLDTELHKILKSFNWKIALSLTDFQRLGLNMDQEDARIMWEELINSGILFPDEAIPSLAIKVENFSKGFESNVKGEFVLDSQVKEQLESASKEIGALLEMKKSRVLRKLKRKLQMRFDDRFVSLERLLEPSFGIWEIFEMTDLDVVENENGDSLLANLMHRSFDGVEEIDVSAFQNTTASEIKINACDYLFRIKDDGRIVLDNLLINQKGKLSGRFNFIKAVSKVDKETEIQDETEAEVLLCESRNLHQVYTGERIFSRYIVLDGLGKRTDEDFLLSDIFIGVGDGEILLVNKLGGQIKPKFCTPVSYSKMSHPIAKILWHFSEIRNPKLTIYQNPEFLRLRYTPRITWNNLILMPRKWYFQGVILEGIPSIKLFIIENQLPDVFLIGESDAELVIDTRQSMDLLIFMDEVNNLETFFIYEYLNTGISNQSGQLTYPQFHYSFNASKMYETKKIGFINKVYQENKAWIALHISVDETLINSVLKEIFDQIKLWNMRWYFLIYDAELTEIRLRVCVEEEEASIEKVKQLSSELILLMGVKRIEKMPYFPEYDKFGVKGMQQSEHIFYLESAYVRKYVRQEEFSLSEYVISIGSIWSELIVEICLEEFLQFYKLKYSGLDLARKKVLQRDFQEHKKTNELIGGSVKLIHSLFSLLEKHPFDAGNEKLSMILNHIHLFCNRMQIFGEQEDAVFYFIYRVLLPRKLNNSLLNDGPIGISTSSSRSTFA